MNLPWLNYHHLHYFREIVRHGGVLRAADKLNVSQSTLSTQLKALEEALDVSLFDRRRRKLELTNDGRRILEFADKIFETGDALRNWCVNRTEVGPREIRVGALSPLSKNLQFEIIRPFVMQGEAKLRVQEGESEELSSRLLEGQLDLVLTNLPLDGRAHQDLQVHLLGEMPVYLVGRPPFKIPPLPFPSWISEIPIFLPSTRTFARVEFDALLLRKRVEPNVVAEVDDMALLRLLALSGAGLALVPEIGVKFELEEHRLLRIEKIPNVYERFYALTRGTEELPQVCGEMIERGREILRGSRLRKGRRAK